MIQTVLVVGSGVMGRGIATSFGTAGFHCTVLSRHPEQVGGLRATGELPREPPDLVIEAVPEDLALKVDLFRRLDDAYEGRSILASNTSSLPLQRIADTLAHPESFCGIHYFHPAERFAYAELIEVAETAPEVVASVILALGRTGKRPIHLRKPVVGALINRLQHALLHEAGHLLDEGVVDVESIDLVARHLLGPRMCVTGVLEQKDLTGTGTLAAVQRELVPHLHHGAEPTRTIQDVAAAGNDGVRTGRGFYDWSGRDVDEYERRTGIKLSRILDIVREP
jgi:3-hydroxybutyryl-CoA dehydrogenase